jgi:geranylgeranyl diphosphate synthase type II
VDDILDVTGTEETLGKHQGSDERLGKRTYVTEFGLEGARDLAAQSRARALAALADAAAPAEAPRLAEAGRPGSGNSELEQITDFIATRSF